MSFGINRLGLGFAAIAVLAMLGCESKPTNFYFLESMGPPAADPVTPRAKLVVEDVKLPHYLDRPDIVSQAGGNRLALPDTEQWAEPLSDGVARVLRADLAHLLADRDVVVVPADFTQGDAQVYVNVSRFEVAASGEAVIEAQWKIVRTDDDHELVLRRFENRTSVTGEGYDAIAAAQNESLHALSRDIAGAVAQQVDLAAIPKPESPRGRR